MHADAGCICCGIEEWPVREFEAPGDFLADLNPESVASLIASAADITLIVDKAGVIRDVAVGGHDWTAELEPRTWIGKAWADTVTVESRVKIAALLRDAADDAPRRWRQVNHAATGGADVPVSYAAVQTGNQGSVVAFGRDLGAVAALQQRLVASQQVIERDYLRLRHVETRYRLLFQTAADASVMVDAATHKMVEVNPAAQAMLGQSEATLVGQPFPDVFMVDDRQAVVSLFFGIRATGNSDVATLQLDRGRGQVRLRADLLRQEDGSRFLVRLAAPSVSSQVRDSAESVLQEVFDRAPDGLVITDLRGQITAANEAFLGLTEMAAMQQLPGESLDRWLGRPGVDLDVLIANLKERGTVTLFATMLRGEHGSTTPVEISATAVQRAAAPCLAFTIRDVGRRLEASPTSGKRELPRSVSQLKELVGRLPMKDIVAETSQMIEQLCLEAALEMTLDNRASAAELLGLSRQSLYVKLRRYGLGDLGP